MRRKGFSKKIAKRVAGCCLFCGEDDPNLLDIHRILPGSEGGTYCDRNSLTVCSLCHRKAHCGRIIIEGKYFSTSGKWVVYYTEDGIDKIK